MLFALYVVLSLFHFFTFSPFHLFTFSPFHLFTFSPLFRGRLAGDVTINKCCKMNRRGVFSYR
ncbi:hypothetical protein HMPREF9151_01190 [Hoylesella saccharolytica F0055]|uniref:Uncharacterized protein n=1 Tax=Hoylesella saccharolytica F0055 TaxID=1127699 RepID=L1NBT7_9BACT|nr:hypothetical protein HMPREF9151_01190 [Hoylesella saccharolytica F0055]